MKSIVHIIRHGIACAMALSVAMPVPPAHAEPELAETTVYYEVKGRHQAEVDNHMLTVGPIAWNKRIGYGMMSPRFSWRNVETRADSDWCTIANISISLAVTYTMPHWTGYPDAPSDLKEKWDYFYERLLLHEKKHTAQALAAARAMEREVLQVRARSCQEAREGIREAYDRNFAVFKQEADALDQRDTHILGLVRGAR